MSYKLNVATMLKMQNSQPLNINSGKTELLPTE
jgi:hypothetical protein